MNAIPFARLGFGLGLLALCVVIHAVVLAFLVRRIRGWRAKDRLQPTHAVWVLIRVAWWTVLAHLFEMVIWAVAFLSLRALPDLETALYFSMTTYTTVGYGDVVLPMKWHLLAGLEGLTGILMAGWSTAFLIAVVTRLITDTEYDITKPSDSTR